MLLFSEHFGFIQSRSTMEPLANNTSPFLPDPTGSGLSKTILSCADAVTMLAVCVCTRFVHTRADVSHPVFAVIFQELLFLSVIATFSWVSVLTTTNFSLYDDEHHHIILVGHGMVRSYHQWSWLVVSGLR